MAGVEGSCLYCGATRPAAGDRCGGCGRSRLVDVKCVSVPGEARERFAAARALSALGPPVPTYTELQARLSRPGAILVSHVSREFGERAVQTLREVGVEATLTAHVVVVSVVSSPATGNLFWGVFKLAILAAAVGGAAFVWRHVSAAGDALVANATDLDTPDNW